jgi:hypothetical protein
LLGWAYLAKTVRKPQRGGVNFDLPMIFCACSMQNTQGVSEIPQDDFRIKPLRTCFGAHAGCGDVTSLYKILVKNQKTNFRRLVIQEPIFLWLIQMGVVAACGIVLAR